MSIALAAVTTVVLSALSPGAEALAPHGHRRAAEVGINYMEGRTTANPYRQGIDLIRNKLSVWYVNASQPEWATARARLIENAYQADNLRWVHLCDGDAFDDGCDYRPQQDMLWEGIDELYEQNYSRFLHFMNLGNPGKDKNWGEDYGGYNFATRTPHNDRGLDYDDIAAWDWFGVGKTWLKRSDFDTYVYPLRSTYGDAWTHNAENKEFYYNENFTLFENMVFPGMDNLAARFFDGFVYNVNKIDFNRRELRPFVSAWESGLCPKTGTAQATFQGVVGTCKSGTWYDNNQVYKENAQVWLGYTMHATDVVVAQHVRNTMSSGHGAWEGVLGENWYTLFKNEELAKIDQDMGTDFWLSHCKLDLSGSTVKTRSAWIRDLVTMVAEYTYLDERPMSPTLDYSLASQPNTYANWAATRAINTGSGLTRQILMHGAMYIANKTGNSAIEYDMCN